MPLGILRFNDASHSSVINNTHDYAMFSNAVSSCKIAW